MGATFSFPDYGFVISTSRPVLLTKSAWYAPTLAECRKVCKEFAKKVGAYKAAPIPVTDKQGGKRVGYAIWYCQRFVYKHEVKSILKALEGQERERRGNVWRQKRP